MCLINCQNEDRECPLKFLVSFFRLLVSSDLYILDLKEYSTLVTLKGKYVNSTANQNAKVRKA